MKSHFQTIALIGKYKSPEIAEPLLRLADFLAGVGLAVVVDKFTNQQLPRHPYGVLALEEMGGKVDLAIVMGGDGTLLNIARMLAPFDIPLVGVNQGHLGFLTDISIDTMQAHHFRDVARRLCDRKTHAVERFDIARRKEYFRVAGV